MNTKNIPRLVIAATQSGSGKTTIVTGLLAALKSRGLTVQSFKIGPDYIDPGYHRLASGRAAHNLDTWLVPSARLPEIFADECSGADIAIVEGVMGLYDGGRGGVSSTAEIAHLIDAPVLLVIDCKSMGASAAAIARGFRDYDSSVNVAGVILNRLGSATHETMIREAMAGVNMPVYGALRRSDELKMPERHLGLLPVEENSEQQVIAKMGAAVASALDIDGITRLAQSSVTACTASDTASAENQPTTGTKKCRIGIARDEAFSFYYPTSLAVLERMGAELVPFSPLHDSELPEVDGIIIGGGFPEMFAAELAANVTMCESISRAADGNMPIYAECGGYMYLLERLVDFSGEPHAMVGVFSGEATMTQKLQMVGYVEAELTEPSILGPVGTTMHGHEFHFSVDSEADTARPFIFTKLRNGARYAAGQSHKRALGSYLHLHFAGCEQSAVSFVAACEDFRQGRE